jgi:hypothetical protein
MFQKTTYKVPKGVLGVTASYFGFSFGAATEPKNGELTVIHSTHTCREGLISNMRSRILGDSVEQPTDKMRMIFRWCLSKGNETADRKTSEAWCKRAIPVLHAFERLAGWPLTRVYRLETGEDFLDAYYFWSSRRWMKASYMVSLYVLLVRMCKDERITGFKDFYSLIKLISKVSKAKQLITDHHYVTSSLPYWEALMVGYPEVFRQRKITYYWDTKRIGGNGGSSEGIQYLVSGDTSYTEARNKVLEIKKNLDKRR